MLASMTRACSPLLTSFPKENFRRRLFRASRQLPQVRGQFFEGRFNFLGEGLAENFPMLGLDRAAVPCCATLQTSDPVVVQIAHIPRRAPMTLDAETSESGNESRCLLARG
jgi:hypothetical protein